MSLDKGDRPTILIVDNDPPNVRLLTTRLAELGYQSRSFDSMEQFVERYDGSETTCVILNVSLAGVGIDQTDAPFVIAGGHAVLDAVQALREGGIGVLPKKHQKTDLGDCITNALAIEVEHHQDEMCRRQILERLQLLTVGEREVLDLLVAGSAHKVIARELKIAIRTVERRRHRILEKLNANSLAEVLTMVAQVQHNHQSNGGSKKP